ncbi:MAG: MupA/Atu3671 family FMN-dependent luciferase-like monooxygenase [Paracoccaceae bacterium]
MTRFTSVVIGNGSLLIGCSEALLERGHQIRAVVTNDANIQNWATGNGIPVFNDAADLEHVGPFDWLFSIANLSVLPDGILALPQQGAINFHDGPLPRHAGLNAPMWALIEGESSYGITWHMLEGGVDEGDIVAQSLFDISGEETGFSLNSKCYAAGIESFADVLAQLENGAPERHPQDLSQRSYHGLKDRPDAAGILDFTQTSGKLLRLINALDVGEYWNPLVCPKIQIGEHVFLVSSAEEAPGHGTPGEILSCDEHSLTVATSDGALRVNGLQDTFAKPIGPNTVFTLGETLPAMSPEEADDLNAALQSTIPGEQGARKALAQMRAVPAPLQRDFTEKGMRSLPVSVPTGMSDVEIALALLVFALTSSDVTLGDIAVSDADMQTRNRQGVVAAWRPLQAGCDESLETLRARLEAELPQLRSDGGWACDLVARDPAIGALSQPEIALMLDHDAPLGGSPLTLATRGGTAQLFGDAALLDNDALKIMSDRLSHILEIIAQRPTTKLGDLDVIAAYEHRLLQEVWNDTSADYDCTQTVHGAFEAQVARTPEATALVFEGTQLSFASLNARANTLAAQLQKAGVGPGNHVGLYLPRSIELVVSALAILKAGAAYVPLDPSYPGQRIAHFISDSQASLILTSESLKAKLPAEAPDVMLVSANPADATADNVDGGASERDLAFLIYTSGSTGTPKGVMVRHSNVANFFAGMDHRIPHKPGDTWLAVTSLNFDISVLEIFWTLSRGLRVVLSGDDSRLQMSGGVKASQAKGMDFNLFYWGNDDGVGPQKYELLLEGAKFADQNGFNAVWTPERHFHAFGGPYPNPSVTGAAVAAVTQNIGVRAGSCVAPLHHPARIAEEWAVIDNLTNGRAALGIASGWQPDDFVLRPENTPPENKPAMFKTIETLRKLWRGEEVSFPRKDGGMHAVVTQPRPVSKELSLWVTTAGNPATWKEAGEIGANVLTHLLGQSIAEVGEKIAIYHKALREAEHNPDDFTVTLMLHTYLSETREDARTIAREPMKNYLRSAAGLIKQYAWAFPAFKKPEGVKSPFEMDLGSLNAEELEAILDFAFERYFEDSGLFGTVEDAVARVDDLKKIGVSEIACLIDYGIEPAVVLEGLKPLAEVLKRSNQIALSEQDLSLAGLIQKNDVTHMQCTPSLARLIAADDVARTAVAGLDHLLLGGEALPGDIAESFANSGGVQMHNMYGPTETTIWSTMHRISDIPAGLVDLGTPIANTTAHILSDAGSRVPIGAPGELFIGGDGVTAGYWQRPDLTADRFPQDPFNGGSERMYRTGDMVRWGSDGRLEFLGRTDHQVKIRGQRIELGEIEAALTALPQVTGAVVVPHNDALACYVTTSTPIEEETIRAHLKANLTDAMVPTHIRFIDAFPLTPNKKIDRKALPDPIQPPSAQVVSDLGSDEGSSAGIAQIWNRILGVSDIRSSNNFFELGGHSLLAVQMHREIRDTLGLKKLGITDIFRFPILKDLAAHVDAISGGMAPVRPEPKLADEPDRSQTMSKRKAMRAGRRNRAG